MPNAVESESTYGALMALSCLDVPEDLINPVQIEAGVLAMVDDVRVWYEKTGSRGRTVTVKIKWADFQQSTRSRSMESPIDGKDRLRDVALTLIRSVFPPAKGIRLVGRHSIQFPVDGRRRGGRAALRD